MYTAKEFKQKLTTVRQQVINQITSTAKCFETYEVAGKLDSTVKLSEGIDEQDSPNMAVEVTKKGMIVVDYDGHNIEVKPKDFETEFLIDVLEQMEITLAKLHLEFS